MNPEDLRAYARRDWEKAAASKEAYWAREFAEHGSIAVFEASRALWRHMRAIRPDWPSPEERQEDLQDHIKLKRLIDRAASVFLGFRR